MAARHVVVIGHVQGVWFRGWTQEKARALGLVGWVRNRADGAVEAHVEGPPEKLDILMALLAKGPAAARVERVDVEAAAPEQAADFVVRR